jgi:hypothetical protein
MVGVVLWLLARTAPEAAAGCSCNRGITLDRRVAEAATVVEGAIVGVGTWTPVFFAEAAKTGVDATQPMRLRVDAVLKPRDGVAAGGEIDVLFQHCATAPLTPRPGEPRLHFLRVDAEGRMVTHFCDWFLSTADTKEGVLAAIAAAAPPAEPVGVPAPAPPAPPPTSAP